MFSLFSLYTRVASEVLSNFNEWQDHAKRLQGLIDDDDDDVDVDVKRKRDPSTAHVLHPPSS